MTVHHFCEIKMCIESIIELCQEGEISVYKADSIVFNEYICSSIHIYELSDKLEYENENKPEGIIAKEYRRVLGNLNVYHDFLKETYKILTEMLESKDYQQKRKNKIKAQILKEGLILSKVEFAEVQNADTKTSNEVEAQPESKATLPPIIQDVMKEGLLNDVPVNGKYTKKGEKKDSEVIKWILDNLPIYEDVLTAELYMQYIQPNVKPQTIGQYITRFRKEAK